MTTADDREFVEEVVDAIKDPVKRIAVLDNRIAVLEGENRAFLKVLKENGPTLQMHDEAVRSHYKAITELQDDVAKLKRQLQHLCDDLIIIRPPRSKRRWRFWE